MRVSSGMAEKRNALWVALGISILLHLVPWLGLRGLSLPTLEPPLPIELVPYTAPKTPTLATDSPKPADTEPAKKEPAPESTLREKRPPRKKIVAKTEGEKVKPPEKLPEGPPPTKDISGLAPAANLVVLVRLDQLSHSPHAAGLESLLSLLPDYDSLLGGTKLSLYGDFQSLMIATSDPRSVTATFLAAKATHLEHVRSELADKSLPKWDPRIFRFIDPDLAILTQPEVADELDAAAAIPKRKRLEPADDARVHWLAQLKSFGDVGTVAEPPLRVTLSQVQLLWRISGLPTPIQVTLAATADAAPWVRIDARFASPEECEKFAAAGWTRILSWWQRQPSFIFMPGALDDLKVTVKESTLEIKGTIPQAALERVWVAAQVFAPRKATNTPVDAATKE